ncbi:tripartite tricarboxylate transporter substrate binding protein [Acidovorax sp. Be4]|uniref:Tripartite tricarboxylate transporter substrate binding protein n=1 Tax=Acidovorax bellezanensis TaxID=2976702 RepID=A0ABT2PHU5_9BURK|nr:tripartite tricarboxylate transporter substrate binding protein [Acidovorax sp. Be4]MCT9810039.1 tripartite tricarboxylate transporter substrate binding protein [Acidovorax sp. Be4]
MPPFSFSPRRRQVLAAGSALAASSLLPTAHAADAWPSRPVRFIVPFPPGGPVDTTARAFSQKLGDIWHQPTVIDNRAGAGGMVGAAAAAKEPADGYTLFVGSIHHSVNPALHAKLSYDIERDFVPVSFAAMFPVFLVAHPSVPASNVRELIALAKQPGSSLSYGSSGNGGGTHLAGELFNMHAGIRLQHIPYKGSAPAMNDLLGGQVQLMFADAPSALQHIKSGRIKVLGVASRQRSTMLPEVPTIAESGLPDYEAYSWAALFAPARTPAAVLEKINTDFNTALRDAGVRQRLLTAGAEADPGTPQQMRERLQSELRKWAQVVKTAGIRPD